jgi:hypothetical protein
MVTSMEIVHNANPYFLQYQCYNRGSSEIVYAQTTGDPTTYYAVTMTINILTKYVRLSAMIVTINIL